MAWGEGGAHVVADGLLFRHALRHAHAQPQPALLPLLEPSSRRLHEPCFCKHLRLSRPRGRRQQKATWRRQRRRSPRPPLPSY